MGNEQVAAVLASHGFTQEQVNQKIAQLSPQDLHQLAQNLDQLQADYKADPRAFLEKWIRDSSVNYNDGTATGMPVHPEGKVSASALQALIDEAKITAPLNHANVAQVLGFTIGTMVLHSGYPEQPRNFP